jgi:hypothetical protein
MINALVFAAALFFTSLTIMQFIINVRVNEDKYNLTYFSVFAAILWGVFYYLTH